MKNIAPGSFEDNGGLFVAISDEDLEYSSSFAEGCNECGIPAQIIPLDRLTKLEPNLTQEIKLAIKVPDASFDAMRLPLRFFASAKSNGAMILPYHEVTALQANSGEISGITVRERGSTKEKNLKADIVINAAGAWVGKIAKFVNLDIPIVPSPGVMVAVNERLCNMVVNRMTLAGDGDIIVPQRKLSVIGTSSWVIDDPDALTLPDEHIQKMIIEGAKLIPKVKQTSIKAAWAAVRPLIGNKNENSRDVSRTFECFDHSLQGVEGFVSVAGGKATTMRAMAEKTSDLVMSKLGLEKPCETMNIPLLPHNAYYR